MPVKQIAGILYVLTAVLSGYWEISLILRSMVGGPWSWWYVVMLGGSVVLLVGGLHTTAPVVKWPWLISVVVTLSLVLWGVFRDAPWVWLVFAVATALVSWGSLTLASILQRDSLVAVVASVALAVWWIPASVRTVSAYLSATTRNADSAGLLWALIPTVLIIASLLTGVVSAKSRGDEPIGTAEQRGPHF
jgi:hypothetical protein